MILDTNAVEDIYKPEEYGKYDNYCNFRTWLICFV